MKIRLETRVAMTVAVLVGVGVVFFCADRSMKAEQQREAARKEKEKEELKWKFYYSQRSYDLKFTIAELKLNLEHYVHGDAERAEVRRQIAEAEKELEALEKERSDRE